MGERHEQKCHRGRHRRGQHAHEKMLHITCHQGNTNQNHNESPPHPSENGENSQGRKPQMLERMRRKGNPHTLLVGMWTGAATLENCVEVFFQRVKTVWRSIFHSRPALRPSNCTAGDLPQRYRCNEMPGHLHPDVSSSNVHNSQTVEGASVSIERWWIKKLWSMYTMEYSSAIRNDKYPFASTWMDLEGIMLSEVSQSD